MIEVSKKYLPYMSSGFDSPKLKLNIGDGFQFMAKHQKEFDIIITDSSDPIGKYWQLIFATGEEFQFLKLDSLRTHNRAIANARA